MQVIEHPSPNHSPRKPGVRVDTVLLHHTASPADDQGDVGAVSWMCNPASKASAHYVIFHDGEVLRLVPESLKAWHAGMGRLPWETCPPYDFNHRSIGIEIVNPGNGVTPFTEAQYVALGELLRDVVGRLGTRARIRQEDGWHFWPSDHDVSRPVYILGHRDVAQPPGRKTDPADNFDWGRVREMLSGRAV